jgi:hypothetical protein
VNGFHRLIVTLVAYFGFVSSVHSQNSVSLPVKIVRCHPESLEGLHRILDMEISSLSYDIIEWLEMVKPKVRISCIGNRLNIKLVDNYGDDINQLSVDKSETITLDFTRYVGLTIIELIASSISNFNLVEKEPPNNALPPDSHQIEIAHMAEPKPRGRWQFGALLHTGGQPFWMTYGAVVLGEVNILYWLSLAADARFSLGEVDVWLGTVRTTLWSGALMVTVPFFVDGLAMRPYLGFRVGGVAWRGTPSAPTEAVGKKLADPWGGPFGALMNSILVSKRIEIFLNIEAGVLLFEAGAMVDGELALDISGVWISLSAGTSMQF